MEFLNKIFGTKKADISPSVTTAAPQSVIAVPNRPYVHKPALDHAKLRKGMWVSTRESVGILTGCGLDGIAEVTVTKPDGTTQMTLDAQDRAVPLVVRASIDKVRAAFIEEIPTARHQGDDHLRSFGYIKQSESL